MVSRQLRRYHRWIGIASSALLVVLAATGFALNHTVDLRLHERFIDAYWVLWLYGIETPAEGDMQSFDTGEHRVTQLGSKLFLDDTEIAVTQVDLVGAATAGRFVAAAEPHRIHLFDDRGSIVDVVHPADAGIANIVSVGTIGTQLWLVTERGAYTYDPETFRYSPARDAAGPGTIPRSTAVPAALEEAILARYRGPGVSIERLLLDLHSGRIFGRIGVLLLDILALGFIVLAATGLWVWAKPRL